MAITLTDLPDDVLLHIFGNLSSWDMLSVMETCLRFSNVGKDRTLWEDADFTEGRLSACQITKDVVPCLQNVTRELHLRGHKPKSRVVNRWKTDTLTPKLLERIEKKSPCLEVLSLHEAGVNAKKLKMLHLGHLRNLHKLSFHSCEFINLPSPTIDGSYFKNTQIFFPHLEELEVCDCQWITDYDLMVLSKVDSIKSLKLKGCVRIGVTIAYMAMSFRFGFRSLETLDMRGTSLQNSDIQSVIQGGKIKSLSIGPIGEVVRMDDDFSDGLSLIFPNPQKKDEPGHGVVVINMGPDGPNWRVASREDIQTLGLDWVQEGIKKREKEKEEAVDHYFIGKEGKVISQIKQKDSGAGCSSKRKRDDSDDEYEPPSKHPHLCQSDDDAEEEERPSSTKLRRSAPPDLSLGDAMLHPLVLNSVRLETLSIAGCAISNEGIRLLMQHIRTLKFVDVSNTLVTKDGLEEARSLNPDCLIEASHC